MLTWSRKLWPPDTLIIYKICNILCILQKGFSNRKICSSDLWVFSRNVYTCSSMFLQFLCKAHLRYFFCFAYYSAFYKCIALYVFFSLVLCDSAKVKLIRLVDIQQSTIHLDPDLLSITYIPLTVNWKSIFSWSMSIFFCWWQLADSTAICSMIGYFHGTVVRPFIHRWRSILWLSDTWYSTGVWTSE